MFRSGLKIILNESPDIRVVGEAATSTAALELTKNTKADVLVADIQSIDEKWITIIHKIKLNQPDLAILLLSMDSEDQYTIASLKAGASGYLSKHRAPRELPGAIRELARGGQNIIHRHPTDELRDKKGGL